MEENELMNDEADTAIGLAATEAVENEEELTFTINANIAFEQIIESEAEETQEINETP